MLLLLASVLVFVSTSPNPSVRLPVERCAAASSRDSVLAAQYQRALDRLRAASTAPASAPTQWVPADSALCARADAAVRRYAVAQEKDRLFVYRASDVSRAAYALIIEVPNPPPGGDWGRGGVCFFDANWRKLGVCVAM